MFPSRQRLVVRNRSLLSATRAAPWLPLLALACLAVPRALLASDDDLPKAGVILDKYVEVTGGKAAYEKINNRLAKGTLKIVGANIKFAMTICAAKPNRYHSLMEAEGFGMIEKGTDGKVVWEISPMRGAHIKEGGERALILRSAALDGDVRWRKLFKKAECVGVETVDDTECYKVVLTPHEGSPETRYYDKESNLIVKMGLSIDTPMGPIEIEAYLSDYKQVDGILLPHKVKEVVAGGTQETLFVAESIEHNVEMPADRFALPKKIQVLLEEEEEEAESEEE